jgi:hypothetical protein
LKKTELYGKDWAIISTSASFHVEHRSGDSFLVFWFWMWGVPGAILAVPMLAILKIVCDRAQPLKALGHVLEG